MPPQTEAQTLIEVIRDEDAGCLKKVINPQPAVKKILEIASRLMRPRVYISEPIGPVGGEDSRMLWGMGADVLSSLLTEQSLRVVTPETLRWIIAYTGAMILDDRLKRRNPFIIDLMDNHVIDEVYVADEDENSEGGLRDKIETVAFDRQIFLHTWKPRIDVVHRRQ
jgi:hypothetical protein